MAVTELFRMVLATYGYKRIGNRIDGIFDTKEQALKIKEHAVGVEITNDTGLGWPRGWRIVRADLEEHDEEHGAIIASCEPVEEQ